MALSLFADLFSGGVAGCCGILATQPLDTVRVRLQTQKASSSTKPGIWSCTQGIIKHEGIRGLYKGVASPSMSVGLMNAVLFFSYESASTYVRKSYHNTDAPLTLGQVYFCGFISGIGSSFITAPTELVKCKAQVCAQSKGYAYEEWLILKNMIRTHGITGRYGPSRGLLLTLLRDSPSFGLYFYIYELICRTGNEYHYEGKWVNLCAGGFAGAAAWGSIYPIDVVKTRWQTAEPGEYKSLRHCITKIYTKEGPGAFLKGFGATMCKAWPQNAVIFFCYEHTKAFLI